VAVGRWQESDHQNRAGYLLGEFVYINTRISGYIAYSQNDTTAVQSATQFEEVQIMVQEIREYKTKEGLFGYAVSLGRCEKTNRRIRIAKTGKTEEIAKAKLVKALEEHNKSIGVVVVVPVSVSSGLTVREAVNEFIRATYLGKKKTITTANYIAVLNLLADDEVCGGMILHSFQWKHLEALHIKLQNATNEDGDYQYGMSYLHKFTFLSKKFFKRCVAKKLMPLDPTQDYDYFAPASKKVSMPVKAFTDARVKAILNALADHPMLWVPFMLEVTTGIRTEENLALKWSCLYREDGYIRIERAITLDYSIDPETLKIGMAKTVLAGTKTMCSVRDIPVGDDVFAMLEDWKAYAAKHTKTKFGKNEYIFGNTKFPHWSYSGFREAINDILVEKDVGKIRLHQARHTAATLAVRNGASPVEIQEMLGHKDLQTTMGYITRNSDMAQKATSAVSKGLAAVLVAKESAG
jgi:integrase